MASPNSRAPGSGGSSSDSPYPTLTNPQIFRFWLVALVGPLVAGVLLSILNVDSNALIGPLIIAPVMFAPLLSAAIAQRSWRDVAAEIRRGFAAPGRNLLLAISAGLSWILASLVLIYVGAATGLTGPVADTSSALATNIASVIGEEVPADAELPSVPVFLAGTAMIGVIAGATINAVFAFGEEYGWRAYLWRGVSDRGRWATIGLVGVLWGLWHAPLILLIGFNYPDHRLAGAAMMVLFTVAASWPMDELRRATGSAVSPAMFHGMINATASALVFLAPGNDLVRAPTGLVGLPAFIAPALLVSWLRRRG